MQSNRHLCVDVRVKRLSLSSLVNKTDNNYYILLGWECILSPWRTTTEISRVSTWTRNWLLERAISQIRFLASFRRQTRVQRPRWRSAVRVISFVACGENSQKFPLKPVGAWGKIKTEHRNQTESKLTTLIFERVEIPALLRLNTYFNVSEFIIFVKLLRIIFNNIAIFKTFSCIWISYP